MEQTEKDLLLLLRNSTVSNEYYRFLIAKHVEKARFEFVNAVRSDYVNKHIDAKRYQELVGVLPSKSLKERRNMFKVQKTLGVDLGESKEYVRNAFNLFMTNAEKSANV